MIKIYTDGACRTSNNSGGWCFVVTKNGEEVCMRTNNLKDTTNNRMEILAAIKALDYCITNNIDEVTIVTDSMYVIGTASLNYKRNTNQKLLEQLDNRLKVIKVNWEHVKGHAGDKFNEKCDSFAVISSNIEEGDADNREE